MEGRGKKTKTVTAGLVCWWRQNKHKKQRPSRSTVFAWTLQTVAACEALTGIKECFSVKLGRMALRIVQYSVTPDNVICDQKEIQRSQYIYTFLANLMHNGSNSVIRNGENNISESSFFFSCVFLFVCIFQKWLFFISAASSNSLWKTYLREHENELCNICTVKSQDRV